MPIYDYGCARCGRITEVIHGIHETGPKFCPECGAEGTMRKGFATPAVHFKGAGWAKKDRLTSASTGKSHVPKAATESGSGSGDSSSRDGSSRKGSDGDSSSREGSSREGSAGASPKSESNASPSTSAATTSSDGGD